MILRLLAAAALLALHTTANQLSPRELEAFSKALGSRPIGMTNGIKVGEISDSRNSRRIPSSIVSQRQSINSIPGQQIFSDFTTTFGRGFESGVAIKPSAPRLSSFGRGLDHHKLVSRPTKAHSSVRSNVHNLDTVTVNGHRSTKAHSSVRSNVHNLDTVTVNGHSEFSAPKQNTVLLDSVNVPNKLHFGFKPIAGPAISHTEKQISTPIRHNTVVSLQALPPTSSGNSQFTHQTSNVAQKEPTEIFRADIKKSLVSAKDAGPAVSAVSKGESADATVQNQQSFGTQKSLNSNSLVKIDSDQQQSDHLIQTRNAGSPTSGLGPIVIHQEPFRVISSPVPFEAVNFDPLAVKSVRSNRSPQKKNKLNSVKQDNIIGNFPITSSIQFTDNNSKKSFISRKIPMKTIKTSSSKSVRKSPVKKHSFKKVHSKPVIQKQFSQRKPTKTQFTASQNINTKVSSRPQILSKSRNAHKTVTSSLKHTHTKKPFSAKIRQSKRLRSPSKSFTGVKAPSSNSGVQVSRVTGGAGALGQLGDFGGSSIVVKTIELDASEADPSSAAFRKALEKATREARAELGVASGESLGVASPDLLKSLGIHSRKKRQIFGGEGQSQAQSVGNALSTGAGLFD